MVASSRPALADPTLTGPLGGRVGVAVAVGVRVGVGDRLRVAVAEDVGVAVRVLVGVGVAVRAGEVVAVADMVGNGARRGFWTRSTLPAASDSSPHAVPRPK